MLENVIRSTCERVRGVFYGWWIVGSVFIIQMLASGLLFQGFTVYFLPLQAEFGWSRTLISTPVSLTRLLPAVVSPFQGWIIDRVGPRPVVLVGVVLMGAGFIVFSFVQSILLFFLAFLLLFFPMVLADHTREHDVRAVTQYSCRSTILIAIRFPSNTVD